MRNQVIQLGLAIALFSMIGIAFVTANTNSTLKAHVWIQPQWLTIDEHECPHFDEWVTAFIQPPKNYSIEDIDLTSITLQVNGGNVPASNHHASHGTILVAEFDRGEVTYLLRTMIGHMTPHPMQKVTLTITGNLHDGNMFRGEDTINVFFTDN